MTLDLISQPELFNLWLDISAEPEYHFDDNGPKTFEEFLKHLEGVTVFAARKGKKFAGAIGFMESKQMLRGIHFIPEVRGTSFTYTAVRAVMLMLHPNKISAKYFADNRRIRLFLSNLGFQLTGYTETTKRNGQDILVEEVSYDPISADLRL